MTPVSLPCRKPMPRPKKPLRRKTLFRPASMLAKGRPMRRVSKKRAAEMRLYSKLRVEFLNAHPICAVWLAENGWERCLWGSLDGYTKQRGPDCKKWIAVEYAFAQELSALGAPRSTEIHHREGRGPNFLRTETWLAVSAQNHRRIHRNPSWARANGFLK